MINKLIPILLFVFMGCNFDFKTLEVEPFRARPFPELLRFKVGNGLGLFSEASSENLVSIEMDSKGNIYAVGYVDDSFTSANDGFILKLDSSGNLLWKVFLTTNSFPYLNNSGVERIASVVLDEGSNALYIAGVTESSLKESNSELSPDLFLMRFNLSGSLQWVQHYGEETQEKLNLSLGRDDLDFSKREDIGQLRKSPWGDLVLTFTTTGNFFEENAGVDTIDIGVMRINPKNGEIIKGIQLGRETLAEWTTKTGIPTDGSYNDYVSSGTFAFDGNKLVLPFRTHGPLVDTNLSPNNNTSDSGYIILTNDLAIEEIKQIGAQTYAEWVSEGHFEGTTHLDDQFRAVVVLGPKDYLFYGKTAGNIAGPNEGIDFWFARFKNHKLVHMNQFGGAKSEEPRNLIRSASGDIYASGHTQSNLFDTTVNSYGTVLMKVSSNGELISGHQLGINTGESLGIDDLNYNLVITQNFIIKDDKIYFGFNNYPEGSKGPSDAYLWSIPID